MAPASRRAPSADNRLAFGQEGSDARARPHYSADSEDGSEGLGEGQKARQARLSVMHFVTVRPKLQRTGLDCRQPNAGELFAIARPMLTTTTGVICDKKPYSFLCELIGKFYLVPVNILQVSTA